MLSSNYLLQNGRYRVVHSLGPVHNGAIYEVQDEHLGVRLVLKEVFINAPEERQRFQEEVQRLARLHHPSLPAVKDQFVEGDRQYLVLEYIEGTNLAQQLQKQKQPFDVNQVLTYADHLLDLLTYLHSQTPPIIHQEINPNYIKFKNNGTIALQHFGIEKVSDKQDTKGVSWAADTLGYLSPELIAGKAVDQRSDIYSLGATLYTLLTNNEPVDARVREQAIMHKIPDPLSNTHLNGNIPPLLAKIVTSSMALDPAKRPANAKIMRQQLKKKEVNEIKEVNEVNEGLEVKSPNLSTTNDILFASPSQKEDQHRRRKKRHKRKKGAKWPFTLELKPYQWVVFGLTILLTIGLVIAMNYLR